MQSACLVYYRKDMTKVINTKRIMICGLVLLLCGNCSSATRREKHSVTKLSLYNLHFRNLSGEGASPIGLPGKPDFQSVPKPNDRFDCEPYSNLFKGVDLLATRECLKSATSSGSLDFDFQLIRDTPTPFMEIKEDKKVQLPECVRQRLSKLTVPREIVFQSNDGGVLGCYSSNLALSLEGGLGQGQRFYAISIHIHVSPEEVPPSGEEMLLLLKTWSLAPYFGLDQQKITSKYFPEAFCRKCMGVQNLLHRSDILPLAWPQHKE